MDWDDLRYLLALRRRGSLAAAARALGVNETTVGRRLGALERSLATRLFERHATGHRLTEAGNRACELGEAMEASAEELARELVGRDAGVEGRVRITAPSGFVHVLAPVLADLQRDHPRLFFDLTVDSAALDLVRREADIAVRMSPSAQASLLVKKVGTTPWALFASEAYVRRRGMPHGDLSSHELVGFEAPLGATPGGRYLADHGAGAKIVVRTNHVVSAIDCAAAGVGVCAAPVFLARREPKLVRVPKPRDVGAGPVVLVAHRDVAKVPRVRTTLDRIATFLRSQPGLVRGEG